MDASHAERIERAIDCAAAAIFAAAIGYAAFRFGLPSGLVAAVAAAFFFGGLKGLTMVVPGSPLFDLEPFEIGQLPVAVEIGELLLTDADRLETPSRVAGSELLLDQVRQQPSMGDDELVLDDVLASLGEGSRVVRLFDLSAMPTPGELKARIDRHLDGPDETLLSPDASKALHDALSELRRTLR